MEKPTSVQKPTSTAPAIEIADLAVTFPDGTRAINGVSFSASRGEFCVILGPSGAGKSTLLRCINGLVKPTRGNLRIDDVWLTRQSMRTLQPRISMIYQQFNLVNRATVAANVLAGALPSVSTARALLQWYPRRFRERASRLIEEVGLEAHHLHRRVSELSGGQQQRVGIARAFMLDPILILADEPVASLDPRTSVATLDLLRTESRQRQTTVLCSLHQLDLARQFADRIIAMRDGAIAFDGPPRGLTDSVVTQVYGPEAVRDRLLPGLADGLDVGRSKFPVAGVLS